MEEQFQLKKSDWVRGVKHCLQGEFLDTPAAVKKIVQSDFQSNGRDVQWAVSARSQRAAARPASIVMGRTAGTA